MMIVNIGFVQLILQTVGSKVMMEMKFKENFLTLDEVVFENLVTILYNRIFKRKAFTSASI